MFIKGPSGAGDFNIFCGRAFFIAIPIGNAMQCNRSAERIFVCCVFNLIILLLNECHEHFIDFIICKIKNSVLFLISKAFLALATRRRRGAGLPGGSGGRAARDPTYGQPPGRSQRSSDFNVFCSDVCK